MRWARRYARLVRAAAGAWADDKASRMAAALAYYSVFSLVPLLLLVIGVAGLTFGEQAARGEVASGLARAVGSSPAAALGDLLGDSYANGTNPLFTTVGLAVLLYGGLRVFGEVRAALNTIWRAAPPGPGRLAGLYAGAVSATAVLGTGLLLIGLLATDVVLTAWTRELGPLAGTVPDRVITSAGSVLVVVLCFAVVYRVLPDAHVRWRDVWVGAVTAGLLYELAKYPISLYVGHFVLRTAFGTATSVVVVLTWVYYTAMIFYFGAELTRASATDTAA